MLIKVYKFCGSILYGAALVLIVCLMFSIVIDLYRLTHQ